MESILPGFHLLQIHDDNCKNANTSNASRAIQRAKRKSKPSSERKAQAALLYKERIYQLLQRQKKQRAKERNRDAELCVMTAVSLSSGGWH